MSDNSNNSNSSGKHNGGKNFKSGNKFKARGPTKDKFKGKCKNLEGFVFDANKYNQADEYVKTWKEIAEYVGTNFDNGDDVRYTIENNKRPDFPKPVKPRNSDETDELIWKKEVDQFVKRREMLEKNLRKLYSLVWGQCTDVMRERLEGLPQYSQIKDDCDSLKLLELIKSINFKFEDQKYPFGSV